VLEHLQAEQNWKDAERCQKAFARQIGIDYHDTPRLIPLDHHSSFAPPLLHHVNWRPSRVDHFAFGLLAHFVNERSRGLEFSERFDQTWLAGHVEEPYEPFTRISEPYIEELERRRLEAVLHDDLAEWAIDLHVLPTARSAWNPGQCLPLVFTFWNGWAETFLKKAALRWRMESDAHPAA
jgi:hypothetical protein